MGFGRQVGIIGAVVLVPLLLAACVLLKRVATDPGMNIEVNISAVNRCSRMSPEILVTNIPAGTRHFDVRLMEFGEEERLLGGGRWANDGSGVIPEGALTYHYLGPCPPAGQQRSYAFIVTAMPEVGNQPLAVRLYRFSQE